MADASKYEENIKKYTKSYNQKAAEKIVGHLGIALRNRDSSLVGCTDQAELDRVREKWLRTKLQLADSNDDLDKAIKAICEKMKAEGGNKSRVTFYYLLAEHYKKLDMLAG
jgi:glutamate racemase